MCFDFIFIYYLSCVTDDRQFFFSLWRKYKITLYSFLIKVEGLFVNKKWKKLVRIIFFFFVILGELELGLLAIYH